MAEKDNNNTASTKKIESVLERVLDKDLLGELKRLEKKFEKVEDVVQEIASALSELESANFDIQTAADGIADTVVVLKDAIKYKSNDTDPSDIAVELSDLKESQGDLKSVAALNIRTVGNIRDKLLDKLKTALFELESSYINVRYYGTGLL